MRIERKVLTYCIIGTIAFTSRTAFIKAAEVPIPGIDIMLSNFYESNVEDSNDIEKYLSSRLANDFTDKAFAQVSDYVNIRSKASEDSEILGKLYNNSFATILEDAGEWYKVQSGSVTGYIKKDYLITGKEAKALAETIGTRIATVNTITLKVREDSNTNSAVLTLIPMGDEYIVKKEIDGWVKIALNGNETGYVSTDYVEVRTDYEEAVSIEEEQERLAAEEAAREAEAQVASTDTSSYTSNSSNSSNAGSSADSSNQLKTVVASSTNSNTSSIRNSIVEYALQFVGNPYVWGGTSLTNGADCSGFTQSVFRDNGISISRTSRTQATGGKRVTIETMQPGDLLFYDRNGTINHVGIYIGNGKVISASSPETGIRITNYNYRQPIKVVSYVD